MTPTQGGQESWPSQTNFGLDTNFSMVWKRSPVY
jgi:hypothetical protein